MNTLQPLHIEIVLKESLEDCWADWFAGLQRTALENGQTRLAGEVADHAALHGLLERVRDLNLNLVSLQVKE